jgi:pentapeptide MXKDX repeat protein
MRAGKNTSKRLEIYPMRKLILAATTLAFVSSTAVSSTAFAQDKAGGTTGPAAQSGDTMSKGDASKDKMAPKKMAKSAKKSSDAKLSNDAK